MASSETKTAFSSTDIDHVEDSLALGQKEDLDNACGEWKDPNDPRNWPTWKVMSLKRLVHLIQFTERHHRKMSIWH